MAFRYNLIVVHGGMLPGVPLEQQQLVHLAALRDVIPQPDGRWEHSCTLQQGLLRQLQLQQLRHFVVQEHTPRQPRALFKNVMPCSNTCFSFPFGTTRALLPTLFTAAQNQHQTDQTRLLPAAAAAVCSFIGLERAEEGSLPWAPFWQGE
jgi:hypothetical protein